MSVARSLARLATCGAAALSFLAAPVHAQGTSVHLTMDRMTRMFNAMKQLSLVAIAHPELGDSLSIDGDATEAQAIAQLARKPVVVAALARAGTTPREYVLTSMAYLGASMGAGMEKSVPGYKLPASIDADNVAFVRAHESELEAMQQKMQAEIQKLVPRDSSSD